MGGGEGGGEGGGGGESGVGRGGEGRGGRGKGGGRRGRGVGKEESIIYMHDPSPITALNTVTSVANGWLLVLLPAPPSTGWGMGYGHTGYGSTRLLSCGEV